ncbi:MAG: hypothetical protein IAE82_06405 [Opitutaceae bacterium]|nr:hypothetical protein [Opitutaceae bacterium]
MTTPFRYFQSSTVALLVACASTASAESIAIDFGKQTTESSYLLFGGCSPNPDHAAVWDTLAAAGITILRFDVKLGVWPDPKDITLEAYKAAIGIKASVADINSWHWDWSRFERTLAICEARGIETMSILNYCPKWLSYSGDSQSPPRDFAVWEDIVQQIVRRYEGRIDFWEIWNEPNGPSFMNLEGSPYPKDKDGMLAAYIDICRHTIDAVRKSGVKARLGGPALATWNSAPFFDKFLAHSDVVENLEFLSHHIYFHAPIANRCLPPAIYEMERKNLVGPLPLYITEWNAKSSVDSTQFELKNSPAAVGWAGKAFVLFLQWGVRGATFYNFHEGRELDDRYGGAYVVVDGRPKLFRFVKVFHLLSKVLGLGDPKGEIKVFDSRVAGLADEMTLEPHALDSLYAVGCVNAQDTPVVIVANSSDVERVADIAIANLADASYQVRAFVVRPDHTPEEAIVPTPLFERTVVAKAGQLLLQFPVGAHSVIGLRIERAASGL